MNPITRRNPLDSAKYREQYLSNLRLEASNNQRNQNANMIFKNTGMTPSRPPDTRTTTERMADIEGIKVELRSKLQEITDGIIASQIIGELEPFQIQFAIQNWDTITADMAKMFANGVPTSAFIAYLNRLIQKYNLTEGVEMGLQQTAGDAIILSNTQLLYGLPREQVWTALDSALNRIQQTTGLNVAEIKARMAETASLVPTKEEQEIVSSLPFDKKQQVFFIANQVFNRFPSNKDISDIIGELNIGLANRDIRYTQQVLEHLYNIVSVEPSVLDQMAELRAILATYVEEREVREVESGFAFDADEIPDANVNPTQPPQILFEEIVEKIGKSPSLREGGVAPERRGGAEQAPQRISRIEWAELGTRAKPAKVAFLNARLRANPDMVLEDTKGKQYGESVSRRGTKFFVETATNNDLDSAYEDYMYQSDSGAVGEGMKAKMKGKGLRPKIDKPYRQSIAHLIDKPVEKPKPYTQFGRYFINKTRLEGEGIIAFRQPSGNTVQQLPTEKISSKLSKVIRTMVGKGIPSYEDIGELTREEKNKLHHICRVCQINSPAVPKMKGEGEQEDDRFEILRGEIIAGNDNPKIAKEFKVMLMKLMNDGRIPRRQANEILTELLAMGH